MSGVENPHDFLAGLRIVIANENFSPSGGKAARFRAEAVDGA